MQMRGSQTPVQKYWRHLLELVQAGKLDPSIVITHRPPLEEAPHAYKLFNEKLVRGAHLASSILAEGAERAVQGCGRCKKMSCWLLSTTVF